MRLPPPYAGLAALLLASCGAVSDAVSPGRAGLAPARVALAARLPALAQAGVVTLRVTSAYERDDASLQPLGTQTLELGDARSQDLPVALDLGACLGDPRHRGAASGSAATCAVRLTLTLLVDGRPVDEQTIGPLVLQPGITTPAPAPLTLYELRSVRIDLPAGSGPRPGGTLRLEVGGTVTLTATALDAAGQPVASRTAAWTSATPAIATVGATTGVVMGVAPGRAQISASLGGRESALDVVVVPRPAPLTVTTAGTGAGTIRSTPAGIDCRASAGRTDGTCTATFPGDAPVTLTAAADQGSGFVGWSDACASAGTAATCTLTIDQARTVRATFGTLRRLAVTGIGDGTGTVTSTPAGIACTLGANPGGSCAASFVDGLTVSLAASSGAPDTFAGWGGECAATTGPTCTLTIGESTRGASVRFARPQTYTAALSGTGEGTVSGGGLACVRRQNATAGTCTATAAFGSTVTLTAAPEPTSTFAGWTGACSGTGPCVVTLDQLRDVGAVFTRRQAGLGVTVGGAGGGTITVDGQRCTLASGQGSTTCVFRIEIGRPVALSAVPDAGSEFGGWSGVCAASGRTTACTVTLADSVASVGAVFVPVPVRVTIVSDTAAGAGAGGTVTSGDGTIACTVQSAATSGSCSALVPVGTTLALSASPATGSFFVRWSGACAGAAPCSVTVRAPTVVGVRFLRQQVPLTIAVSGTGSGSVTLNGGVACTLAPNAGSVSCPGSLDVGAPVTIRLQPAAGSVAQSWGGPCTAVAVTAPCTFTPTGAAVSVPVSFALVGSVSVRPVAGYGGGGRVRSSDQRIDCTIAPVTGAISGTCDAVYPAGTSVTLALTSFTMERFVGAWSGLCASSSTTCAFTVPAAGGTARITLPEFVNLSVAWTGSGITSFTFSDSTTQPSCFSGGVGSFTCTAAASEGSTITLTAASTLPNGFRGWTGDCAAAGSAPICTRTIPFRGTTNLPYLIGAQFDFAFALAVTGGAGTVAVQGGAGADASCTNTGLGQTGCTLRTLTRTATLVATPAAGNVFVGWDVFQCTTGSPTCVVDVTSTGQITATFAPASALLTLGFDPLSTGRRFLSVASPALGCSSDPSINGGVPTGNACAGASVPVGASYTVVATGSNPSTGFVGWTGSAPCRGVQSLSCTFTLTGPTVVQGRFGGLLSPTLLLVTDAFGAGTVTVRTIRGTTDFTQPGGGEQQISLNLFVGDSVTFTASPTPPQQFAFWGTGACQAFEGDPVCTVVFDSTADVTANFGVSALRAPSSARAAPVRRLPGRLVPVARPRP